MTAVVSLSKCDILTPASLHREPDSKVFVAKSLLTSIVHRTASRIAIGPELCRDENFIRQSQEFFGSIFANAFLITYLPLGPFRRLLAWPISVFHRRKLRQTIGLILPIVKRRVKERASGVVAPERIDAIEWTLGLIGWAIHRR